MARTGKRSSTSIKYCSRICLQTLCKADLPSFRVHFAYTKTQILSAHFEDDLPSVPAFTCYAIALISSLSKLIRMISYVYERTK